ncbi:MAG TPA: M20/M25/M40 family metallo-hydrolase, partial [Thermoanaerobaculia bacterium]|nr:M20/M25/M40 family metallo-hydrolase [Thermoanaerobaculia bacterium]
VGYFLEVRDKGGHSSLPVKENAIYRLAGALSRLSAYEFPVHLNEVTRAYLAHRAKTEAGSLASDLSKSLATPPDAPAIARLSSTSPYFNALFRTTCVATMLEAGHAPNALPQLARATVNCRILPGETPDEVLAVLRRVVDDEHVAARIDPTWGVVEASPASPLRDDVLAAVAQARSALWPGAAVVPVMETGATDGFFLRRAGIPTYGISGVFIDMDDVRAHGRDERVSVSSFYEGLEFWVRLVRATAGGGSSGNLGK